MGITVTSNQATQMSQEPITKRRNQAFELLRMWELYPILFIATFLRLYRIDTVTFVDDQAVVFSMARDAIVHGLWPITSNRASLGNLNFPLVVHLFILPAAISSNPLWAEVMVGLLNTTAILLAYFFTRRYYGRLAGTIVALLYATSVAALTYSGDIWPQNLLPPFVMLFLFSLFRGVVEQRRGWLFPALLLLGGLYQLHGSALLLAALLVVSCIFAFKTIRWYEIPLAAVLLLIVCFPYLFWEWKSNFADLKILLGASKTPAHVDWDAWHLYKFFLSPYIHSAASRIDILPTHPHSVLVDSPLRHLRILLRLEHALMPWLLLCGVVTTALLILRLQRHQLSNREMIETADRRGGIRSWLVDLWGTPHRQGLLLLLIWQALLPMTLLRHSIPLFPHYFIIFLPGQFILIGLFISRVIDFVHSHRPAWSMVTRYGMGALIAWIVGAQLIGSVSHLIDTTRGNFEGQVIFPAYNDLSSLQHVLNEADQLAQERHIGRIYVATNYSTGSAMRYLIKQVKTPIMAFDTWHCIVLPDPGAGPVVFVSQSSQPQVDAIVGHYAAATLVDQPKRLGGTPFNLFILTAKPRATPAAQTFTHDVHLLDQHALQVQNKNTNDRWLVTRWSVTRSEKPAVRKFYNVHFDIQLEGKKQQRDEPINCSTTSLWTGDQYFTMQGLGPHDRMPAFVTVRAYSFVSSPVTIPLGPLTLATFGQEDSPWVPLQTTDGKTSIRLSSS